MEILTPYYNLWVVFTENSKIETKISNKTREANTVPMLLCDSETWVTFNG